MFFGIMTIFEFDIYNTEITFINHNHLLTNH